MNNPFALKKCPFCFEQFTLGDCTVFSSTQFDENGEELVVRPKLEGIRRITEQFIPQKLSYDLFQKHQPYRQCPKCKKPLPYNITSNENCVIGIIGGRGSGKSHYIAALIETLLYRIPTYYEKLGIIEIAPLPKIQAQYRRNYYEPLFVQRGKLQANIPGTLTDPLVFTCSFRPLLEGMHPRSLNLVIIDVSGEDLSNDTNMVRTARFLLHAKGLIMVVDPLVSPSVINCLPEGLKPTEPSGENPLDVLNNLILNTRQHRGMKDGSTLPLPLAVAIGKGDLLGNVINRSDTQIASLIGHDRQLIDADYRNGFRHEIYNYFSTASEKFLNQFDNAPLVQRARQAFRSVSFSAVSATGSHFDEKSGKFQASISPRRCADPLLWLFHQLGYLQTESVTPDPGAIRNP
ncbi:hypothetical protein EYB53_012260 [Candidatus Chloroploca sp. M-50]|uniref:AAA+ ATPase domain-containing protein n=1 Tax=Candidatus Chloroploca mongolica TaxID=2528176 RepID=A0ABS4DAL4_9CHLR|nr:hypothetical protein [Candidatus Chloroploca mongolica]MBP1466479.1 hypothetical protein [Candidatus Chloroploca mongolica]